MSKYVSIKEPLHERYGHEAASVIGSLLTAMENIGYAYSLEDDVNEAIIDVMEEHCIDWAIETDEGDYGEEEW